MLKATNYLKASSYIYIYIYIGCALFSLLLVFLFSNNTFADNVDYTVNVSPSLNISLSGDIDTTSNNVVLNLNPNNKTSDSRDVIVKVGTNNITGYKLSMSSADDSTSLIRDSSIDGKVNTIPTLSSAAGTTADSLPNNTWGYRLNNTGSFIPFTSNTKLLENNTATNEDTTTLTFASKIDYNQMAGRYAATLAFTATAHPNYPLIQDITKSICKDQASSSNMYVMDERDYSVYTIRYINGNCWMTRDLNYDITTYTTTPDTSNVNSVYPAQPNAGVFTDTYTDPVDYYYNGKHYYNYCALSAGTVCERRGSTTISYDICPKGWYTPSSMEASTVLEYIDDFDSSDTYIGSNGALYEGTGYYRLRNYGSANGAYSMYVYFDGRSPRVNDDIFYQKIFGLPARCIAK